MKTISANTIIRSYRLDGIKRTQQVHKQKKDQP